MVEIRKQVALDGYTTLKVGGPAEYFTTVSTEDDLREAVLFAQKQGLAIHVLGGGSNTLVPDEGVQGLVIHVTLKGVQMQELNGEVHLTAAAGEELDAVIAYSVEQGWWGLENLSHIPGSVGATPVQNVGAYEVETSDVLLSVRAFDTQTNSFVVLKHDACVFGYRDSLFKHEAGKQYIIVAVTYKLTTNPSPHISYRDLALLFEGRTPTQKEIREAVMKIRSGKFPDWRHIGTAGSFFKNPHITKEQFAALRAGYPELPGYEEQNGTVKVPLGWILDKVLHLRGYKEGAISSFKDQALVLVAEEGATAEEIKKYAAKIAQLVKEKTDITIAWEVTLMH